MKNRLGIFFLTGLFLQAHLSFSISWQLPAIDLSATGKNADYSQVAMNDSGDAVAVWARVNDESNYIIQTRRYSGGSWGPVEDLSATGRNAYEPQVVMNDSGDAVAVWRRQDDAGDYIIQTRRYSGGSWSSVTNDLSAPGQNAYGPQVAMNDSGDAVAVWRRWDGSDNITQAIMYSGGSWEALPTDLSAPGQNSYDPRIAMNASGDAVALWGRFDGDVIIQTKRYSGGSWEAVPTNLSAVGYNGEDPQIAMNDSGEAIAIWDRSDGSDNIIQARRYSGGTWDLVANLSAAEESADSAQIAMNDSGDAIAIWYRSDGSTDIVQTRRCSGGIWEPVVDLSVVGQTTDTPQIAMNNSGDAVAVWQISYANDVVQARRYSNGSWEPAVYLSDVGQDAWSPQVAMNDSGAAVAVWTIDETNNIVQASQFNLGLAAPSNLAAFLKKYCSPMQVNLIHALSWDKVDDAVKYRVYVDPGVANSLTAVLSGISDVSDNQSAGCSLSGAKVGALIAEPPAVESPSVDVYNRCPGRMVTYYVTAVDNDGDNGKAASITV